MSSRSLGAQSAGRPRQLNKSTKTKKPWLWLFHLRRFLIQILLQIGDKLQVLLRSHIQSLPIYASLHASSREGLDSYSSCSLQATVHATAATTSGIISVLHPAQMQSELTAPQSSFAACLFASPVATGGCGPAESRYWRMVPHTYLWSQLVPAAVGPCQTAASIRPSPLANLFRMQCLKPRVAQIDAPSGGPLAAARLLRVVCSCPLCSSTEGSGRQR